MDATSIAESIIGPAPDGSAELLYLFAGLVGYKAFEMLMDLFKKVGGFMN